MPYSNGKHKHTVMKIITAEYIKSVLKSDDLPKDNRPEFAFVGRSNVGKSSLLNTLLRRKGLAKTSSTPGKTQTINFFEINKQFYFVDLPGYGYAKVPKAMKDAWNRYMREYLFNREPLKMAAVLLDARHTPTANDAEMIDMLADAEVATLLVATKIDKLNRNQRVKQLQIIKSNLGLEADDYVLPFSSVTGEGVQPMWEIISDILTVNEPE